MSSGGAEREREGEGVEEREEEEVLQRISPPWVKMKNDTNILDVKGEREREREK